MAELGDPLLFGLAPGAEAGVTVDMLDFEFVDKCKDEHKLRAILAVLMSGKEGVYPEVCFLFHVNHIFWCIHLTVLFYAASESHGGEAAIGPTAQGESQSAEVAATTDLSRRSGSCGGECG
jgi:hypothetical protein